MTLGINGFNQYSGVGLGFVAAQPAGFDWSNLFGDLARGGLNIVSAVVTPPSYEQNAGGVTIRGGAPVLATSQPGGNASTQPGSSGTGANLTAGGGTLSAGISTQGMLIAGLGVLALVLVMGRR